MSIGIDTASLYSLYGNKDSFVTNSISGLTAEGLESAEDEKLLEACKSFETYFVEQVFKEMEKTVQRSDENEYTEYFGDMLYENYAKEVSNSGSLGIAQMLYESMKR